MGYVRAETCPQYSNGTWLVLRVWFYRDIQNVSLAHNNKANRFTGQGPNGTRLARIGAGPSWNQVPYASVTSNPIALPAPREAASTIERIAYTNTVLYHSSSSQGQRQID